MSTAKGRREPTRHRIGAEIGVDGKTIYVTLVCAACNHGDQTEPFALDTPFTKQLKETSCLWCGRLGAMKQKGAAA